MNAYRLKNLLWIAGCCALCSALATAADSPRSGSKSIVFQGSRTNRAPGAKLNRFAIMGQVARPGAYEIDHAHPEMLELIQAAGGISDGATGALRVIRQGRPGLQAFYSPRLQYELLPGDLVVVDKVGGGHGGAKHMHLAQFQNGVSSAAKPPKGADVVQVGLVQLADYPLVMHVPSDQPTLRNVLLRLRQTLPPNATVSVIKAGSRPQSVSAAEAGEFELVNNTVLVFDRSSIDLAALPELPQPLRIAGAAAAPLTLQAPERGPQGMPVVRPGNPGGPMLAPNALPLTARVTETALPVQSSTPAIAQAPPTVPMPVPEPFATAPAAKAAPGFSAFGGEPAFATQAPPPSTRGAGSPGSEPLASLESAAATSSAAASDPAVDGEAALSDGFEKSEPLNAEGDAAAEVGLEPPASEAPTGSSPLTVLLIAALLFGTVLLVVWNVSRPRAQARPAVVSKSAAAPRMPTPISAVSLPTPMAPLATPTPVAAVPSLAPVASVPTPVAIAAVAAPAPITAVAAPTPNAVVPLPAPTAAVKTPPAIAAVATPTPIAPVQSPAPIAAVPLWAQIAAVAPPVPLAYVAPPAPIPAVPLRAPLAFMAAPEPVASVPLPAPIPAPVTEVPAAPPKSRSAVTAVNPLDAIIENRLAIDVEPLVLPSELPIHGRPVSEPSFRVDAGHEQGAPHFGVGRMSSPRSAGRRAQRVRTERTSITVRETMESVQTVTPAIREMERAEGAAPRRGSQRTPGVTSPESRSQSPA